MSEVVGVDAAPGMVEEFRKKLEANHKSNVSVKCGKITDLEEDIGKFDLVVSVLTFHHIDDIVALLTQLKPLLNEKGAVVGLDLLKEPHSLKFHNAHAHKHGGLYLYLPVLYNICLFRLKVSISDGCI